MGCEGYRALARVYDRLNADLDYGAWADFIEACFQKYGATRPELVLDLACGTGTMTRALAARGYDMIGVDGSADMLTEAYSRAVDLPRLLFLQQDMREFELYGTVAAVVSICDSMNYLTEYEDFVETLRLANNYLDPEGVFIFDLNTVHKYRDVIGDSTIAESREECSFIWNNSYDEESQINEYELTLFIQEEDDLYRRYDENHYQRAYTLDEVRAAVAEAGMELVAVYDAFTREPAREDSERVYVIAREQFCEGKTYV